MTTVAVLPVPTEKGGIAYRGVAGDKWSHGNTVEEAVDALTAQLPDDGTSLLVVVQNLRPDRFFDAAQQRRLGELMGAMHLARDAGAALPADEQAELEALIEAELYASGKRAAMLADEAGR